MCVLIYIQTHNTQIYLYTYIKVGHNTNTKVGHIRFIFFTYRPIG